MNTPFRSLIGLLVTGAVLSSCSSTQPVAQVRDDVYFMPSMPPVSESTGTPVDDSTFSEDYYDSATASEFSTPRDYYDMTYNDPYYYNYDRFGLGAGSMGWNTYWSVSMGWGSPCMGSMWGMGMGTGAWYGGNTGMYGYSPWFYDPWPRYPSWGYGMGIYGGCGYGPYHGPWGSCYGCYAPVVICGTSNSVIAHRPTLGGGSAPTGGAAGTRMMLRDPVSLDPVRRELARPPSYMTQESRGVRPNNAQERSRDPMQGVSRPPQGNKERANPPSRSAPQRMENSRGGGGFNSGGGGGGSRSPGISRPR